MTLRTDARETAEIDKKFRLLFNPLVPLLDETVFNIQTGKLEVPVHIQMKVDFANKNWNYTATIINKKAKTASANFGAIKTNFQKEVAKKETKLFMAAVAKIFEEKYGLKAEKIDVEYILEQKGKGLNPEQVCDKRILEIEPDKVTWLSHKHDWTIVPIENLFVPICRTCRYQHTHLFSERINAENALLKLPKTKLGLLINHFKNYENKGGKLWHQEIMLS